jgi:hypothetical protein
MYCVLELSTTTLAINIRRILPHSDAFLLPSYYMLIKSVTVQQIDCRFVKSLLLKQPLFQIASTLSWEPSPFGETNVRYVLTSSIVQSTRFIVPKSIWETTSNAIHKHLQEECVTVCVCYDVSFWTYLVFYIETFSATQMFDSRGTCFETL